MKKEAIKINIGRNKIINLYINKETNSEKIIKMIKKGVQKPFDYFNNVKKISFDIELIYSRKEMNIKLKFKTPNWLIAHSFGKKFIIFEPSKIEKCTSHKRNEFAKIIAHETSHIMLKKINPDFCTWLNEGIAQNIANQKKKIEIKPKNIKYFIKNCLFINSGYKKFISNQGYEISYRLTKSLIDSYDKKTLLKLLKLKYYFDKSSEKNFCKILQKNKQELIEKFIKVLEGPLK